MANEDHHDALKKAARQRWRAALIRSAWVLAISAVLLVLLLWLLRSPSVRAEVKLLGLSIIAVLFFLLALGLLLGSLLRKLGAKWIAIPFWLLLAAVYLLPVLVFAGLAEFQSGLLRLQGYAEPYAGLIPSSQPWLFTTQVILLFLLLLARTRPDLRALMRSSASAFSEVRKKLLPGVLAGAGLWLLAGMLGSVLSALAGGGDISLLVHNSPGGWIVLVFAALIAAPLGVEIGFRHLLQDRWQGTQGWIGAAAAVSGFWAVLQLNWLFLPSVFLVGFGLAYLRREFNLGVVVLAHATFNLFSLLAGWSLFL